MRNYVFKGLCSYDDREYEFVVMGRDLDDAWHRVSIYYPEFYSVSFVREYTE